MKIFLIMAFLIICSVIDIKNKKVNMVICYFFAGLGILYKLFIINENIIQLTLGLVPGILLLIISLITKEGIGKGDGIVFLIVGIYIGVTNSCIILIYSLFITVIMGSIFLIILKRKKNYRIPFVPFVLIGYIISLL